MEACLQMVNVSQAAETLSSGSIQSTPFFVFLENFNCCHMKHEVETDRHSNPQDTLDAGSTTQGGGFEGFEGFERDESPEGGRAGASDPSNLSNTSNTSNSTAELEERVRRDCRRECRRNLFVELLKTVAKVAGVILAAMGLSSFSEED